MVLQMPAGGFAFLGVIRADLLRAVFQGVGQLFGGDFSQIFREFERRFGLSLRMLAGDLFAGGAVLGGGRRRPAVAPPLRRVSAPGVVPGRHLPAHTSDVVVNRNRYRTALPVQRSHHVTHLNPPSSFQAQICGRKRAQRAP